MVSLLPSKEALGSHRNTRPGHLHAHETEGHAQPGHDGETTMPPLVRLSHWHDITATMQRVWVERVLPCLCSHLWNGPRRFAFEGLPSAAFVRGPMPHGSSYYG
jgi:hypothetical protein